MAKIWLKIWLKVKENGAKKIKLAKMVAKEKKFLVRTPKLFFSNECMLFKQSGQGAHHSYLPYLQIVFFK